MRRTTRTAAAAVAIAVALGAGSPLAATAAGHDGAAHVKAEKSSKSQKGQKGQERKAAQQVRQVLRDIEKTDERLVRAARESRTAEIGDHAATVLANVAGDRAALVELASAVGAAGSGSDLRAVRKQLQDLREQNYTNVVNDLRRALELGAEIIAARAALAGDPAAPVADLDAAQVALDSAVARAGLVTASSSKADLHAVKADLVAADAALDAVRAHLETLAPVVDPAEGEAGEEPVLEDDAVV